MTKLLLLETSTDICSVGIMCGNELLAIKETERSFSHSEVITIFIQDCLNEAGIDIQELSGVAIADGPGSYTALRIGSSTAKGICFTLGIPLIAINTLEALAQPLIDQLQDKAYIVPMIDARRKEVYHAIYTEEGECMQNTMPIILDESTFTDLDDYPIHFCGDGVVKAKDILKLDKAHFHNFECSVKHMMALASEKFNKKSFVDILSYEPNYFKAPNITVQKKNILR